VTIRWGNSWSSISLWKKRWAAPVSRFSCSRTSRTSPCSLIARQSQWAAAYHDLHLVQMPVSSSPGFLLPERFGHIWTKTSAPSTDRFVTHVDTAFEKQRLHVSVRKQKAVVEVDRVGDNQRRKTIASRTFGRGEHPSSLPQSK